MSTARIGIVTVSDRASAGVYEDLGGPAIRDFLTAHLTSDWEGVARLVPDEIPAVSAALIELADDQAMDRVRARIDSVVQDPATAEALKPWYKQFCKRPCFHDDYLPTFNRPNVHQIGRAHV